MIFPVYTVMFECCDIFKKKWYVDGIMHTKELAFVILQLSLYKEQKLIGMRILTFLGVSDKVLEADIVDNKKKNGAL